MKRNRLFPAICLVAALLLSACSQDEPGENSTALPEGEYPLQIGSVTLTAEVSEQPWTRMAESTDGMSSEFKAGDAIGVSLYGKTATYTYDGNTWTSEAPLYWKDKQPATVTAWYPVDEEIDFTQQDVKGLTYLLKGTSNTDADYDTPANLTFTHQLAKVRVKLEGAKANEVTAVTVRSYPKATHNQGTNVTKEGDAAYYPMLKANYGGETYWEANLLDGHLEAANTFRVSSDGKNFVQAKLTTDVNITPGYVHTININVGEAKPVEGKISDDGYYLVSGTFDQQITITGGNPTIYLEGASINVSDGPAINITGGNPTIHVFGKNNTITSSNGAGIYVAESYSVTIKGNTTDDELTVTGNNGGAGVGGYVMKTNVSPYYYENIPCGNISISNVKLTASCNSNYVAAGYSAGIGAAGNSMVGSIDINNAIVTAIGQGNDLMGAAAIGGGIDALQTQTDFDITISDSEIHATRGTSYASYIGAAGAQTRPIGYDVISTAKITNSTIYNESGTVITQ